MFINNLTGELHMTEEILFKCERCGKEIAIRVYVGYSSWIKTNDCEHYRCIKFPICRGFWQDFGNLINSPYVEGIFYEYSGTIAQNAVMVINKELEKKYFEELRRMVFG